MNEKITLSLDKEQVALLYYLVSSCISDNEQDFKEGKLKTAGGLFKMLAESILDE